MTPPRKNKVIHTEGREIISKVIEGCDAEARENAYKLNVKQATKRAAFYTGVGITTIKTIRKDNHERNINRPDELLSTPGKKRKTRPEHTVMNVDDFDRCVIKNIIHDFYVRERKVPSVPKLLPVIRSKIHFPWERKSLNRLLIQMGYKWKKCQSRRKVLIERADIVARRHGYLRKIEEYRQAGREIIYLDESWIDSNLTFRKCWQHSDEFGAYSDTNSSNRLIVLLAGSENGSVPNSQLIYKAGSTTGDYHGQMNHINFERWVNEKLLPNIPPGSVIVMDNAPYHTVQVDKPPSKYATNITMLNWLRNKGIEADSKLHKVDLYKLVQQHMPPEKIFRIDKRLAEVGHNVLRLPPYMCDLNPIELAWAKVKRIVRENNVTGDMSLTRLKELADMALQSVTKEDWEGYCRHALKVENKYREENTLLPQIIDSIVISLGDIAESDSSGEENGANDDDGVGDDGGDDDDDQEDDSEQEELAAPLPVF